MNKVKAAYAQMKGVRTCGVVESDIEPGIVKYAKPVGIIGALIPVTNPELTPAMKSLWSLKTRNAIILAPHPRALEINNRVAGRIRSVLEKYDYPVDLVLSIDKPSKEVSRELMRQCDLVLATGGSEMVHAAYSSGTPTYGVGTGNAYTIVDDTVDPYETAKKIRLSKTADNASGCSADNGTLVCDKIYERMIEALASEGGYLIQNGSAEKERLASAMWTAPGVLNREIIAQPASKIARKAGIPAPSNTDFLMVEEEGVGPNYPFSREKLSPVLTIYRWKEFEHAVDMINQITYHCGAGHSCGIHSYDETRIARLAEKARVARVTVRQAHALANAGAWTNGLTNTCTLGCGTWGGSIVSENVNYRHLLNITRLSYETEGREPSDEELFGSDVLRSLD
jgi:sulfoacetaldehyde dehydrogenase